MSDCYDSRECCLRGSHYNDKECMALAKTYDFDGQCPFCKSSRKAKGSRSLAYLAGERKETKPVTFSFKERRRRKGA